MKQIHSDDTVRRCREMRAAGILPAEITARTGVSKGTIRKWCEGTARRKAGGPIMTPYGPSVDIKPHIARGLCTRVIEAILACPHQPKLGQIAAQIGASPETLERALHIDPRGDSILKQFGQEPRPPGGIRPETVGDGVNSRTRRARARRAIPLYAAVDAYLATMPGTAEASKAMDGVREVMS